MGSDRARRTYDETKQYRRVVHQQGRVVLEADLNEAQEILTEETRRVAADVVGPVGVSLSKAVPEPHLAKLVIDIPATRKKFDFSVSLGVIYVGGLRVEFDKPFDYSNQPDWAEAPLPQTNPGKEILYLELEEQEVSAVEDHVLLEPALGGPDTAQRLRLVRRVRRAPTQVTLGPDAEKVCEGVLADAKTAWEKEGKVFDPKTMRLLPQSRLRARYAAPPATNDPCTPEVQTGYLGDENQLVRIQIDDATPTAPQILWAYDNASALYAATATIGQDSTTLALVQTPVDAYHRPAKDQYAEVLVPSLDISDGPTQGGDPHDFAAAPTGTVLRIASDYRDDDQTIVLASALTSTLHGKQVFVRIWENRQSFTLGTAVELVEHGGTATGLQISIEAAPGVTTTPLTRGDFWMLALRPSAAGTVDPLRYLDAGGQPPDGPRRWGTPLAAISWGTPDGSTVSQLSCVPFFDDLVQLTRRVAALEARRTDGRCTVVIRPGDLVNGDLQSLIDEAVDSRTLPDHLTVCLMPGVYSLSAPLRLITNRNGGRDYSNLTIEGAHGIVLLQADAPGKLAPPSFVDGVVVLDGADDVTLRGLQLGLWCAPFARRTDPLLAGLGSAQLGGHAGEVETLGIAIGVRLLDCRNITITECQIFTNNGPTAQHLGKLWSAAVLAGGGVISLLLKDNTFAGFPDFECYGYVHVATMTLNLVPLVSPAGPFTTGTAGGTVVQTEFEDARFEGNEFFAFVAAGLVIANTGAVRLERNRVRFSYAGFWFSDTAFPSLRALPDYPIRKGLSLWRSLPPPLLTKSYWTPTLVLFPSPIPFGEGDLYDALESALIKVGETFNNPFASEFAVHATGNDIEVEPAVTRPNAAPVFDAPPVVLGPPAVGPIPALPPLVAPTVGPIPAPAVAPPPSVAPTVVQSGPALAVVAENGPISSAIVNDNKFHSDATILSDNNSTVLLATHRVVMTGNLVVNAHDTGNALHAGSPYGPNGTGPMVGAVTGNAFIGSTNLTWPWIGLNYPPPAP